MNDNIEELDYVRHTNPLINRGLKMGVEEISEDGTQAKCSHVTPEDTKTEWFPLAELILVEKAGGEFVD